MTLIRFALSLPTRYAHQLGSLRLWSEVEVLETKEMIWLRAERLDEERWEQCRCLPDADRFTVLDDGQLVPVDAVVPRGRLPNGNWQPIDRWLEPWLPPASWPAKTPAPIRLELVRSAEPREPNWLLVGLEVWVNYAVTAPQVRLSRLSFAATGDGFAMVRGQPLPPLLGEQFVETQGIAVPAGWTWRPAIEPAVLREVFSLATGDSVLWTASDNCQKILADDWVQATRSAARLTLEEVAHVG